MGNGKLMTMYTDCLLDIGYVTEEWLKEHEEENGYLIDIMIPEEVLRDFYENKLIDKYEMPFEQWYSEESVAEDIDNLFYFTEWRPYLTDIVRWN